MNLSGICPDRSYQAEHLMLTCLSRTYFGISYDLLSFIAGVTDVLMNLQASMTVVSVVPLMVVYNFFYLECFHWTSIGAVIFCWQRVSSVSLRAKTVAIGTIVNYAFQCMWNFVLPYMFNPDEANMGSKINFIFTGFSLMSIFVFYFYQPETAGRSFEDVDEMFAAKIPARKWKNYVTEAMTENKKAYDDMKGVRVEHAENAEDVV
ncbi:hypothetical protein FOA43_002640 [Brettanomyces nanus]|uniref:Uncharacterized protein n=1 Tax=Eeniella nana TaxID=13502 RepID=A0A875S6D1_EENNA|nr:uncharacterized protein FOA43_002640 [Brettanomyces nanus]QPG75289.1 hypothetical protein FOA43_002640 [Brettanomyces nanus]